MTIISLDQIVRLIHILASVTWVGGLIFTNFVLTPPATGKGIPPALIRLMCMQRYKWFALGSLGILALTGVYNVIRHVPSLDAIFATPWGNAVVIKVILAILAIAVTAFTSLVLGPSVVKGAPKPGPKQPGPSPALISHESRLVLLSQVNLALGVLLIYLGIVLR